jgi:hypothetical protein
MCGFNKKANRAICGGALLGRITRCTKKEE